MAGLLMPVTVQCIPAAFVCTCVRSKSASSEPASDSGSPLLWHRLWNQVQVEGKLEAVLLNEGPCCKWAAAGAALFARTPNAKLDIVDNWSMTY
jgi:hypothetical protein